MIGPTLSGLRQLASRGVRRVWLREDVWLSAVAELGDYRNKLLLPVAVPSTEFYLYAMRVGRKTARGEQE